MIPLNVALASALKIGSLAAVSFAVNDVLDDQIEAVEENEKDSVPIKFLKVAGYVIIGGVVTGMIAKQFADLVDVTFGVVDQPS